MKKAHFIGIAGIGMSAAAMLLREQGWEVSGSDEGFYPPVSDYLEKHQIPVMTPHAPEHIPADADMIVIGKHAKLTEENPEVKVAYESGIPVTSYPEVLGEILKNRTSIVAAGSYGKSTTTALLAWCLVHAGRNPGYFIGAIPQNFDTTSHLGTDPEFIVEGDEYPSSNTDPRSKFLHYHAHDLLLTAATHDHVNVFPTHKDFLVTFQTLIASLPSDGLFVVCADEKHALALRQYAGCPVVTYSRDQIDADYYADDIRYGETTEFTLMHDKEALVEIETQLLGAHNVQNIIGISALLLERNLITPEQLKAALKVFGGITRRLDKKTSTSHVPAYEGFGSSYEKAQSAIEAMRLHFPSRRLVVVFEPHTFSWRNRNMVRWYDSVFADADHVFVYHPPEHGAASHEQLSHAEILERVQAQGVSAAGLDDPKSGMQTVVDSLSENDVVLLLTSGSLDGMVTSIPQELDQRFS